MLLPLYLTEQWSLRGAGLDQRSLASRESGQLSVPVNVVVGCCGFELFLRLLLKDGLHESLHGSKSKPCGPMVFQESVSRCGKVRRVYGEAGGVEHPTVAPHRPEVNEVVVVRGEQEFESKHPPRLFVENSKMSARTTATAMRMFATLP